MSSEALLSDIIPFAGSGLLGSAMGFALRQPRIQQVVFLFQSNPPLAFSCYPAGRDRNDGMYGSCWNRLRS